MITHVPEGLVPFAPCGFERTPETPLVGQAVTLRCRTEKTDIAPRLEWTVDGVRKPELFGAPKGNGCFEFALGAFDRPARVRYRFLAGREETKAFTFSVCVRQPLGAPRDLIARRGSALAVFEDDFAVELRAGVHGFLLRCLRVFDAHGEAVDDMRIASGEYVLEIRKTSVFWELKRSSQRLAGADALYLTRDGEGRILRVGMAFSHTGRHVFGLGERFDGVERMGRGTDVKVVEKFTRQSDQSYLPVPFFFNERGFGFYRSGSIPLRADIAEIVTLEQPVEGAEALTEDYLLTGGPRRQLAALIGLTGRPKLPPDWAFGVWISANGWDCDAEVDAQLDAIRRYGYEASVMVLEAWSDEETFYRWNGGGRWKNPAQTVRGIRDAGLHLVLWQIPVLKRMEDASEAHLRDEREAVKSGFVVRSGDGAPYRIPDLWFKGSLLLDFSNPEARRWWFQKREYLLKMGVEGFKTDGGEFLYDQTARLDDGTSGLAARNLYANQYAAAYHEFMEQHGLPGVTFSRAGFAGAQATPMHWTGDQLSTFEELRAQLSAGLSAGLSGILFWGFDIGGFAGELPSKELYLRATAMACFCPIMQWHAEPRSGQFYATHEDGYQNDRSPWNLAEKLNDPEVLELACMYARLRRRLAVYIQEEAQFCVEEARPLMAHLVLDFPDDPTAWRTHDQYMFGRRFLVAPVTAEGASGRGVYLPAGAWRDYFTHVPYAGGAHYNVACPLDRIPVFERMEG